MLRVRRAPAAVWGPRGQHRYKASIYPPYRGGPLPRTPWTVRGPPPGGPLPWYMRENLSVREQLPELDTVTYAEKQYRVPWLAKPPDFPPWQRGWNDPLYRQGPRLEEMPDYKERPCYIYHQRSRLLEGVKQALWLTKTKLIEGLPPRVLDIIGEPGNQLENQDEKVQNAIFHAHFWVTHKESTTKDTYSPLLLDNLLNLCRMTTIKHPLLSKRMLAKRYKVSAVWERESNLLRVCGINGVLLNAMTPLEPVASKDEILATENHVLETFYPISPIIDFQAVNVYKLQNDTGFREGYPYPYAHTVYFTESSKNPVPKFHPEQLRAKMLMFAFCNALAKAKTFYGAEPKVLETPIVVQSIGTDGHLFHFMVFQLNTTDLDSSDGIKNLVWIDSDQMLYEDARSRPQIRRKVVILPAGIHGYEPETFKKFLALYLQGAV
uniref:Large ribosomal subunit protein mL37 n=1 Tax=Sphenodon punctatus TaxID=8508 RepID=A0A8D0HDL5_SPHPU